MEKLLNLFNKNKNFLLFLCVGLLNTLFGYSIFAFFLWIGIHFSIAALISTIAGVLFNFSTFGRIVFNNKSYSNLPKFTAVYALNYFLGVGVLYYCDELNYNLYFIQALLLVPTAILRYLLMKYFVYK
ncbi:GtrA family protein [bacterium]|nr:GtrA family protein [bacterium]